MTIVMDDPSTYLSRDQDVIVIVLASTQQILMSIARQYGVSIQVDPPDGTGIWTVRNEEEAQAVADNRPPDTPWAAIPDGQWSSTTYEILYRYFGPPKRLDQVFNVVNKGKAWRPDQIFL